MMNLVPVIFDTRFFYDQAIPVENKMKASLFQKTENRFA